MVTAAEVRAARRIAVVGCSGSGKSTLSRELGPRLGLPVVHFDALHWAPGWVERDAVETRRRIEDAVATERWITDGNYGAYSGTRLARADLVIWLDYPRHVCMTRVLKRVWTTHGTVRPDMGEGCPERFDAEFLRWVWNWPAHNRPGQLDRIQDCEAPVLWFRHPRATERWLATL
ncbi:MAG: adenylate kinase [Myxococcota bacterium]